MRKRFASILVAVGLAIGGMVATAPDASATAIELCNQSGADVGGIGVTPYTSGGYRGILPYAHCTASTFATWPQVGGYYIGPGYCARITDAYRNNLVTYVAPGMYYMNAYYTTVYVYAYKCSG